MHFRTDDDGVGRGDEGIFGNGLTGIPKRYFGGEGPAVVDNRLFVSIIDVDCKGTMSQT